MARRPLQTAIYQELPPVRTGNPLFCHQEFLEKMEENRANTVGRRAALLLHRLLVDVRRQYYKSTQGDNRGWRRSPLGGNHGSHFYAWWAPRGAAPLQPNGEFEAAPQGSIFLRDIRHHDDHSPLNAQSLAEQYLPIGVSELKQSGLVPPPWTASQARFADARQKIRIIKGFPGSGKTTALWHAAESAGRESILYVTYSSELATLARDHFDKFAAGQKRFHVVTFAQLIRQLLEIDVPFEPVRLSRQAFVKEISGLSTTILGSWLTKKPALYDEAHAHLIGATLPTPIGRFSGFPDRRVSARQYRDQRERFIGKYAAEAAVEVCETLRRRDSRTLEQRFFRELDLAWDAIRRIRSAGAGPFAGFDCIALDEAQDLTPVESLALVELAAALGPDTCLLAAGDEAQTVRPTDFEWAWFQDLIHHRLASPMEFKLQTNLRSPRRIATLVNRVGDLYGAIAKQERPGGTSAAEIDENAGDQVILCAAKNGPELDQLLSAFADREGLAMIALGEEIPAYVPEAMRDRVLTTFEAKGLDFQSVCVLEAGRWVDRIFVNREHGHGVEIDDLEKRLAIDQLRVALSRPSERLYWLDVNPNERTTSAAANLLNFGDPVYPVVPALLLKSLDEEALDAEERVRLCEADARQMIEAKPALAWSRARQAVALLGDPGSQFSVSDPVARQSAHLTLCQVAFTMAMRRVSLPAEIGRVDLFVQASGSAAHAGRQRLSSLITVIGEHERNYGNQKWGTLFRMMYSLSSQAKELEPWFVQELQPRMQGWTQAVEEGVDTSPKMVLSVLSDLYPVFMPLDAAARSARLREQVLRSMLRNQDFGAALDLLRDSADPDPLLVAECHSGLGQYEAAAAEYLKAGRSEDALHCYRQIPDFDRALEMLERLPKHPALQSLLWLRQMRDLAAARPPEFGKTVLPKEKKLLEQILESSLGATRKKPAAKRATVPKKAPKASDRGPAKPF